jgi:hypothetical protein
MKTALSSNPTLIKKDEELAQQFERALKCQMCNQIISGYDFQAGVTEHGITHTIVVCSRCYQEIIQQDMASDDYLN